MTYRVSFHTAQDAANIDRLAAVNFFLGCVGAVQVTRIFNYRRSLDGSTKEALKDMEHEMVEPAKAAAHKVEAAIEKKSS